MLAGRSARTGQVRVVRQRDFAARPAHFRALGGRSQDAAQAPRELADVTRRVEEPFTSSVTRCGSAVARAATAGRPALKGGHLHAAPRDDQVRVDFRQGLDQVGHRLVGAEPPDVQDRGLVGQPELAARGAAVALVRTEARSVFCGVPLIAGSAGQRTCTSWPCPARPAASRWVKYDVPSICG
jgi:hypothetical protein